MSWRVAYKVPVRAMCGDADVRNAPVDGMGDRMTVDDDGTIAHLCDCLTKSMGRLSRSLKMFGRRISQWTGGDKRWMTA